MPAYSCLFHPHTHHNRIVCPSLEQILYRWISLTRRGRNARPVSQSVSQKQDRDPSSWRLSNKFTNHQNCLPDKLMITHFVLNKNITALTPMPIQSIVCIVSVDMLSSVPSDGERNRESQESWRLLVEECITNIAKLRILFNRPGEAGAVLQPPPSFVK